MPQPAPAPRPVPVVVRPFEPSDFPRTCALMPPEWRFEGCTPTERDAQAQMDTACVLAVANVRLVAETPAGAARAAGAGDPGEPNERPLAGFLLARLEGLSAPDDAPRWEAVCDEARAVLHAAGERGRRVAAYEDQLGERGDLLIAAAGADRGDDNELELFVASPLMRGRGAGGALLAAFEEALRHAGARSYWLQTDSTCTWEWYERHGYRRVADVELDERFPMPDAPEARRRAPGPARHVPAAPHVFMYRKDL